MFLSNYLPHAQTHAQASRDHPLIPCKPDALRKLEFDILWWCFKVFVTYAIARELLFIIVPRVSSYLKKALLRSLGSKEDTFVEAVAVAAEDAAEDLVEAATDAAGDLVEAAADAVKSLPSASTVCAAARDSVCEAAGDVAEALGDAAEAVGDALETLAAAGSDAAPAATAPATAATAAGLHHIYMPTIAEVPEVKIKEEKVIV